MALHFLFRPRHIAALTTLLLFPLLSCSVQAQQPEFGTRVDRGLVENDDINEASGIAASRRNPGILWTHNDSGDSTRVFAVGPNGENLGEFFLSGASARDWEDIAVGPGPKADVSYLYVGEIGDNNAQYETKRIYRVAEPDVDQSAEPSTHTLEHVGTITYVYPDGPRDAEALMVDPLTRDIYIVSKREESVRVYRAAYPQSTTETITLEHVATLEGLTFITGGDISKDGMHILLKDYQTIFYWYRQEDESVAEAFARKPINPPYTLEPQGEGIAWSIDEAGYFTLSEEPQGIAAHLYFYPQLNVSAVQDQGTENSSDKRPDLTKE